MIARRITFVCSVLLAVVSFPLTGFADTLYLKNGQKVEGKIVRRTEDTLYVGSSDEYAVPYWLDEIDRIEESPSGSTREIAPFPSVAPSTDVAPGSTSDVERRQSKLSLHEPSPDKTNAAIFYQKAGSLLAPLPEDFQIQVTAVIQHGWGEKNPQLKDLLYRNELAMNAFKSAAQLPECYFTSGEPLKKDTKTELPKHIAEVNIAKLVLVMGAHRPTGCPYPQVPDRRC